VFGYRCLNASIRWNARRCSLLDDVKPGHGLLSFRYCDFCFNLCKGPGWIVVSELQRHFRVSPPSVHQMIVALERNGFIRRQPGVPRSIEILVPLESLPILEWLGMKTSKSV
jgi:hypothetical protein